jgi:homoserine O-succinyltransferase
MRSRGASYTADEEELVIGFVNNMPAAATRATEAQFRSLIDRAAQQYDVPVRFSILPSCTLQEGEGLATDVNLEKVEFLRSTRIDGMIVTGTQPQAIAITDEPIWPSLARLVEWADENTISTIWSCLAAHAAAYHLDGLPRRRLSKKLSGVFECERASDHSLIDNIPERWHVPHSRYNGLDEEALLRSGYSILSYSPRIGADTIAKQYTSLFVLMQGHPEYSADSLLREYRRDVRRFLAGETKAYPEVPEHYFDPTTVAGLAALQNRSLRRPDLVLLAELDSIIATPPASRWCDPAVSFYAQWLLHLIEQKQACRPLSLSVQA